MKIKQSDGTNNYVHIYIVVTLLFYFTSTYKASLNFRHVVLRRRKHPIYGNDTMIEHTSLVNLMLCYQQTKAENSFEIPHI